MHKNNIITYLHSAFRAFDESAAPQGLYAISEFRAGPQPKPQNLADWQLILNPTIERLGYETPKKIAAKSVEAGRFLCFGDRKQLSIELVRFSKIKVRLYGDTYRLDPHVDFAERWKQLRLSGRIRSNVHPFWDHQRILFLIAFAKGPRAFHRELSELHEKLGATEQSAVHTKDQWSDPHGRGFETLCASWYWPGQQKELPL
jgi:hypothetical protein